MKISKIIDLACTTEHFFPGIFCGFLKVPVMKNKTSEQILSSSFVLKFIIYFCFEYYIQIVFVKPQLYSHSFMGCGVSQDTQNSGTVWKCTVELKEAGLP